MRFHRSTGAISAAAGLLAASGTVWAQSGPALARYFGFEDPRILVVDEDPGPAIAADIDRDGLTDLVIANNRKSRIEIYTQRATPRTDEEIAREFKVNEFKPSTWFDRTDVSVAHRVTAIRAADIDGDGDSDIIYAGTPGEVVVLRHGERLAFEADGKRRLPSLSAGQDGLEIADVTGGPEPELIVLSGGKVEVYALGHSGPEGDPQILGSGNAIPAFFVEDYNGDGLLDILGVVPDDDAPLRVWVQQNRGGSSAKVGTIGPELRFEMPAVLEVEPVRYPGRPAAGVAVIERASRRFVLLDMVTTAMDAPARGGPVRERDGNAEVHAFPGAADNERAVEVADIDGDGLADLLATDAATNSLLLFRQDRIAGLAEYERFSAFKKPRTVAAGQWDNDPPLEVFVLSEEEKAVGISEFDPATGRLGFPQPFETSTAGASPVAMGFCSWNGEPAVAIVMRDKRDHTMEIHRADGTVITAPMADVNRPPQSLLAGDFDRDGHTDILLFTPNEPMVMVRSTPAEASESGAAWTLDVRTDKQMRQYGLVQAAGPENTALFDIDGDGPQELLVADGNFIRACQFDLDKGWRVVDQVTIAEPKTELGSLAVLERAGETLIVAADRGNKRILITGRDAEKAWVVTDKIRLTGFDLGPIRAGSFGGDTEPTVLIRSTDGFAIVRLAGEVIAMEEVAAYRSDEDDRLEHEIEIGDVNADGYLDLVYLDAREQMAGILSISAARKLIPATEFKVFESRLFSGGQSREYQPKAAIISDVTGDGAQDIVLQVHDRFLIYPQMKRGRD
jgi:hypothetical protein